MYRKSVLLVFVSFLLFSAVPETRLVERGVDVTNPRDSGQPVLSGLGQYGRVDWWPMYRHDPQHTGYSTSIAPNTNQLFWTKQFGDWVRSSPTVHNDLVFIASDDDNIYALNATTGEEIWRYTTGDEVASSAAVAYGCVYVGSYDRKIYCLTETKGEFLWSFQTGGAIFSSPCVTENKVVFGSNDHKLYCLETTTGNHLWNYSTGGEVHSSPAVADGNIFFGSLDGKVYALDLTSGTLIWSSTIGSTTVSPCVVNGKVFISSSKTIYCLDASDGDLIWSYTTEGVIHSSPAIAGGNIYIGCNDCKIYCLNAVNGQSKWNFTTGDIIYSSPAVADGKVFFGSDDEKVYCLNATTGTFTWSYDTGGYIRTSSPAVANKVVFIASSYYPPFSGKLFAFGPANTRPVAANLTITPSSPVTTDNLSGSYDYYDEDGDPESGTLIRWYKDDALQPGLNDALDVSSTLTNKSEVWYFTVRPKDGKDFGELKTSPSVIIVNSPPSIDSFAPTETNPKVYENSTLTFTHTSSDLDNDPLTYSWLLDDIEQTNTQNWTYTPDFGSAGIHNVTLMVFDGELSVTRQWNVTIINVNRPPTIDSYYPLTDPTITEKEFQEFNVTYSDPDVDPITVQWYLNGTPTVTTDSYIFNATAGSAGIYNVTVVISDGVDQDMHMWTFTVVVNTPPVAYDLSITPFLPTTLDALIANYTYYDSDSDPEKGTEIRWYKDGLLQPELNDTLIVSSNFTAKGDTWNFTVRPMDGKDFGELQTSVSVTVQNSPPIIDPYYPLTNPTIAEGESQDFSITKSDADLDSLTVAWYLNGTKLSETSDSYTYIADFWSAGTYNVTVAVSDSSSQTEHEWILTVTNIERDVAITNVEPCKTVVGQGYSLSYNVTVENQGNYTETFNVTVYADTTIINQTEVTLINGSFAIITFTWNTTDVAKGNYTITVHVTPVPYETDTADNTVTDGIITVTIPGDVDGDFDVDLYDVVKICVAYRSEKGDPTYVPNRDINCDGVINLYDVVIACIHYGQKCP